MSADLFAATIGRLGIALPLKVDREFTGSIVDQNGMPVLQADMNAEFLPDAEADQLAALIVVAVNTSAGIVAAQPETAHG
jgi:hypothetical protein